MMVALMPPLRARPFRVDLIPNGHTIGCAACHINPAGGGPRNLFGTDVEALVGSSSASFWSPTLAAKDSDHDSFTNGEELGDPDGDGVPIPGAVVANPGLASSTPPPPPDPFAEWQDANFSLPGEADLALETADPDGDGLPNLVEYTLKLDPQAPDNSPFPPASLTPGGQLAVALAVRNDDARLQVGLVASANVLFDATEPVALSQEEPEVGGGFKRLHFTDAVTKTEVSGRLFRWVFSRDP